MASAMVSDQRRRGAPGYAELGACWSRMSWPRMTWVPPRHRCDRARHALPLVGTHGLCWATNQMLGAGCAYMLWWQLPAKSQVGQLKTRARSSTDRASDYGSEGWGFESLRARPAQRPLPIMEGALLITRLLQRGLRCGRYDAGEDVGSLGELVADDVRYTRSVIEGSAWPSRAATTCTGTPASSRVVAWTCLRSCSRA
jgi:hypothetical protein